MALSHSPKIVTNNLLLYYDAANTKSYPGTGTAWNDLTTNQYNGTLVDGPTFSTNIFSFDGLNDRVHVSSPSDRFAWTPSGAGNNTLSIDVWFKTSETNGNLISKPWNGNGEYNYRFLPNSLALQIGAQSYNANFTSLATGSWTHAVFILTSTQVGIYKNGDIHLAFANHSITNNTPSNGNQNINLSIMTLYPYSDGWAGDASHALLGDLALLKIYNKQLTQSEASQNFNALRGRFGV